MFLISHLPANARRDAERSGKRQRRRDPPLAHSVAGGGEVKLQDIRSNYNT